MRAHQVLFASLWIAMGCTLSFAQAVTETKVLADFEDGTSGIFDKGPGIADTVDLTAMEGFDHRELLQLCTVNRDFPLGVDALFVDSAGRMVAVPRTTHIHMKDPQWHT